ncbi:hypothetical protein [Streptomyces sp. Wh19]|uniref:hypothetical protein n=1 Tax=Streptomyces sp. Wh19 TaxID=3076629 RepID=UPI00295892B5|nr:hypothetical protein [Streptomyces sp. Wh19]MDV9201855.1 hypothetical protein [Streptomyces sp. Wh19]
MGRATGMLVPAVTLSLAGCDSGDGTGGGGNKESAAAAIEAARAYQQASMDQDRKAACEARTERLRRSWGADTIAECVEITGTSRLQNHSDAQVSTGEAVEIEAFGPHPAGIGLRVTVEPGTAARGMSINTALRLVPGGRGTWLVDQAVNLAETESPDGEDVRAALRRK